MLFGLLRIMWCYMKSGLHDATFLDLTYFMLRCFTLPTSCQAAWCPQNLCMLFEVVVMMLSWWIFFSTSRYAAWPFLHHAKSCQFASSFPYHVSLTGLVFMMLRCLILSTSCYAASPSRCHTTLPGIFVWIFEFVFILLCCSIVFTSCCTAWPLIATPYYLLYLLQIAVFQLDLVFVVSTLHGVICFMLPCFTLSTSCQTASCPLDKVYLMSNCFTLSILSTSCYGTELSQQDVMLLDGPYFMLWWSILPSRRYAGWSYLTRAKFLTFPCFVLPCQYFKTGLHDAFSTSCYAPWPCLVLVMLRCLIFNTRYYVAWPSIPSVALLNVLHIRSCHAVRFCLYDATPCYAAWSLYIMLCHVANTFNRLFWAPEIILGTTGFSHVASAASLVTHVWFQLENNKAGVRRPNLQILWRT